MKGLMLLIVLIALLVFAIPVVYSGVGNEKLANETLNYKVDGHQVEWLNTLQKVYPSEELRFVSTGEIYTEKDGKKGPDGEGKATSSYPCPEAPIYSVVGKIGNNGTCFLIGSEKTIFPEYEDFLFLWFNDDTPGDNNNMFRVKLTITRPICGDTFCAESEIGVCYEDCDWCGDKSCDVSETCSSCPSDCNVCPSEEINIKDLVEDYYSSLNAKDFESILNFISGNIEDYFKEMIRFKKEFDKISDFSNVQKEFLPEIKNNNLVVEIGKLETDNARIKATFDSGLEEVKVEKIGGVWKITDVHDGRTWLSERYDMSKLRKDNNDYLDTILPNDSDIKKSKFSPKILFWILIILVLVGLFFGIKAYLNRKYISIPIKKNKGYKESFIKRIFKKSHKEDIKGSLKESVGKKEDKITTPIQTKTCPKCQTKLFNHEKFCVKCGKKVD